MLNRALSAGACGIKARIDVDVFERGTEVESAPPVNDLASTVDKENDTRRMKTVKATRSTSSSFGAKRSTRAKSAVDPTRIALSPLGANGATTTTTTPLARARSLVQRETGEVFRMASDAASAIEAMDLEDASVSASESRSRRGAASSSTSSGTDEIVAFARDVARAADEAVARAETLERDLEDALAALAASADDLAEIERERETWESEREAWEFTLLYESREREKAANKARELEEVLSVREREIEAMRTSAPKTRPPSAAARYAVANLRDEIRAMLRAEIEREIREEEARK
ncbi:Zinc finger, C2H2-type matrin [Ostreococcus tauri]|uniref:Zinc finger, C2H2-type matrin n=1 Tax=Ostreococcus tauri TaxID=70448 RepID=A0A096PB02_OSTTA|nr:Zinc finger, C2H2-type matrin [Ostreococcus tauri]CEG02193.1 Zinc finger, C2H2-type matrin [Ostreococcus tauri]|eukprot:XP_003083130.2 Zinc finger, C2H2-type matrin [Ostreococcus tauri]